MSVAVGNAVEFNGILCPTCARVRGVQTFKTEPPGGGTPPQTKAQGQGHEQLARAEPPEERARAAPGRSERPVAPADREAHTGLLPVQDALPCFTAIPFFCLS